jgi:hypothetical protein
MDDHDWHLFDDEAGLEVRRSGEGWEVRRTTGETAGEVTVLTDAEFDQLREAGPNPKGL